MEAPAAGTTAALDRSGGDRSRGRREARPRAVQSRWLVVVLAYALLLAFPAELVLVGPLRSNGGPVRLLGLLAMFLLVAGSLRWGRPMAVRPIAVVLLLYLAYAVFAWGMAHRRPLSSGGVAQVDRDLLMAVSAIGIALLCVVVVSTLRRAHILVGCLVAGGAVSAVVGVLQSAGVIRSWAETLNLPFMTTVVSPGAVTSRNGLARVSGAAAHPIEYAVCLALVLPLAIHLAVHASSARGRRWALLASGVILLGFPLGLSRGGLLAAAIAVLLYSNFLPGRHRIALLGGAGLVVGVAVVVAPQVTTTFTQMISGAADDNSVTGRLDDYPRAFAQWAASPWFGGAPSDISVRQTVLDNEWLATLVSGGVVGVVALALLFVGSAAVAAKASHRAASTPAARSLNGALAASLAAAAVTAGTFDFLAFQQVTFLVVLMAGLVGVVQDSRVTIEARGSGPAVGGTELLPTAVHRNE